MPIKEKIKAFFAGFLILPNQTKKLLTLGLILAFTLALPLFIWGVITGNFNISKRAASGEPTPIPTPVNSVNWRTQWASFSATNFEIQVPNGKTFKVNPSKPCNVQTGEMVCVHSNPPYLNSQGKHYMTLEVQWFEYDIEMRMFIYLYSDGKKWWSNEIRVYNGQPAPSSGWVYYRGMFFNSPVGQPFTQGQQFVLNGTDPKTGGPVTLRFSNVKFYAFLNYLTPPRSCTASCISANVTGTCSQASPCKNTSQRFDSLPKVAYKVDYSNCPAGVRVDAGLSPFTGQNTPTGTWLGAAIFLKSGTSQSWNFCNSTVCWTFSAGQALYWRIIDKATNNVVNTCSGSYSVSYGTPTPSTPTPPVTNHIPVIYTSSLPLAFTGKFYTARIEGYDSDTGDNLSLNISNLPSGIKSQGCSSVVASEKKVTSCTISGNPTISGNYQVNVYLDDGRGGNASKNIELMVW